MQSVRQGELMQMGQPEDVMQTLRTSASSIGCALASTGRTSASRARPAASTVVGHTTPGMDGIDASRCAEPWSAAEVALGTRASLGGATGVALDAHGRPGTAAAGHARPLAKADGSSIGRTGPRAAAAKAGPRAAARPRCAPMGAATPSEKSGEAANRRDWF
jgi:hypothetical protein